jgi:epoxyqueuosine reductase QueG
MDQEARLFYDSGDNASPRGAERLFAEPFFGWAAGDDPAWLQLKSAAGESSWTPLDAFRQGNSVAAATSSELSVLVAVLPQTPETTRDQAASAGLPSERWLVSRHLHGQAVNGLAARLCARLKSMGIGCVAPDLLPGFRTLPHPEYVFTSPWSHRHAGWAAGLGTFGLSEGLITRAGMAHRLTSVVLKARVAPTPRDYRGFRDWCLYYARGKCGKCMRRCPAGALGPEGHDKSLCRDFMNGTVKPWASERFTGLPGAYACGLCQAGVPCASRAPLAGCL